jgi:hypothetical protein
MKRALDSLLFACALGPLVSCHGSCPDWDSGICHRTNGVYIVTEASPDESLVGSELELTDTEVHIRYQRDGKDLEVVYTISEQID